MSQPTHDPSIASAIGQLLRLGVLLSASALMGGGIVYLWRHGAERVDEQTPNVYRFEEQLDRRPAEYRRPADVARAAWQGRARALIQVGVMLLIATPLLRVLYTALAFARRRDWVYVVLPLVVFAVLILGLITGQVE